MAKQLVNIEMQGNEHGNLHSNTIYAQLLDDDGSLLISATLEYILAAIRDRNLTVNGVTVSRDKQGNSTVALEH